MPRLAFYSPPPPVEPMVPGLCARILAFTDVSRHSEDISGTPSAHGGAVLRQSFTVWRQQCR
eukprot:CAMPEP_0114120292 /NCGR_PEP_ID=MMETSP0043_2-20121206/6570_1 /TAXON_ID=464988 /ORGANISM="Hemiselmis andersenii, Strain CCMP644" /LENGTH=61 /DNA_ID=CAMNT_0001212903 /DNA_START=51 /DNA_END=236 /DNA_ORIENTATION=+